MAKIKDLQLTLEYDDDALPQLLTPDEIYERASDIKQLVMLREDRRIERKPAGVHVNVLGEYFSMWANTQPDGGIIVVGIEDKGEISGCHNLNPDRLNALEAVGATYCPEARYDSKRVPAQLPNGQPSFLEVFRVEYRPDRVVRHVSGKAFIRVADQKRELNPDDIHELAIDKGEKPHEEEIVPLAYPGDFNMVLVQNFVDSFRAATHGDYLPDIKVLELKHLGKIKEDKFLPNLACALLFAKDPGAIVPGCKVRFLRFNGEFEKTGEEYNVIKDIFIEGPISVVIDETARILDGQLREFRHLDKDGRFYTAPEYPRVAWFEALVNACVHRSYGLKNMNVFIKMFDDHLEIESPGGFPPFVTPENIYEMHVPRNPRMMHTLYYLSLVREHNEGTKRMRKTMSEMHLPPQEFRQIAGNAGFAKFKVVLRNNHNQRKTWVDTDVSKILGDAIVEKLDTNDRLVLNYVAENGSINVSQCLKQVPGLPKWHSAKRLLDKLVEKGALIHHSDRLRDPHSSFTFPGKPRPLRESMRRGSKTI